MWSILIVFSINMLFASTDKLVTEILLYQYPILFSATPIFTISKKEFYSIPVRSAMVLNGLIPTKPNGFTSRINLKFRLTGNGKEMSGLIII
jgi:hypothetical protein